MFDAVNTNIDRSIRLLLGAFGGYAFTAGWIALIGALLARTSISQAGAINIAFVSGLIAYVVVIIWASATSALLRTAMIVIASSALMITVAPHIAEGIQS